MKPTKPSARKSPRLRFAAGCLFLAGLILIDLPATAADYRFELVSTGAEDILGGFASQQVVLTTNCPAGIKRAPAGLAAPLYGQITVGPRNAPATYYLIVDEPVGRAPRLFVDANGNGDFSHDAAAQWDPDPYLNDQNDKHYTNYTGSAMIKVHYGAAVANLGLSAYRLDKNDPRRAEVKDDFFYYADYYRTGQVTLGDKSYAALLADTGTVGDFRPDGTTNKPSTVLYLDVNTDGKFSRTGEAFWPGTPFNLGGTSYVLTNLTAPGDFFQILKSDAMVAETKPLPVLIAGHPALSFTATNTAGQPVKFPEAYRGRVVMLDFWATWCGPCKGEVPYIAAAYKKFHDRGFDILGVSLDRTNSAGRLAAFTKDHEMPWPQIYEGKFWKCSIPQQYVIDSIPHAFLVDGTTGQILAEGDDLRGDKLEPAVARALVTRTSVTQSAR